MLVCYVAVAWIYWNTTQLFKGHERQHYNLLDGNPSVRFQAPTPSCNEASTRYLNCYRQYQRHSSIHLCHSREKTSYTTLEEAKTNFSPTSCNYAIYRTALHAKPPTVGAVHEVTYRLHGSTMLSDSFTIQLLYTCHCHRAKGGWPQQKSSCY